MRQIELFYLSSIAVIFLSRSWSYQSWPCVLIINAFKDGTGMITCISYSCTFTPRQKSPIDSMYDIFTNTIRYTTSTLPATEFFFTTCINVLPTEITMEDSPPLLTLPQFKSFYFLYIFISLQFPTLSLVRIFQVIPFAMICHIIYPWTP